MSFNGKDQYVSWAPYGATYIGEHEIGMNATVAQTFGLKEGTLVKCSLNTEAMVLYSITASVTSQKDWEILVRRAQYRGAFMFDLNAEELIDCFFYF